jgi:hypothetical protein
MTLFNVLDFFALCAICWTSFAALEGGNEVNDWRRALLVISLIGIMVSSFIGAIIVAVDLPELRWFVRGIIYSGTLFAFWFYDRRFGIGRHVRMARECIALRFAAARKWINSRRAPQ